mmetsp:Transcript_40819/g.91831  ORF Transcript_40819/g.91831 Transcript_40819/m.91831 type:complete len:404 (-) Transcript_40819:1344-2555(-)
MVSWFSSLQPRWARARVASRRQSRDGTLASVTRAGTVSISCTSVNRWAVSGPSAMLAKKAAHWHMRSSPATLPRLHDLKTALVTALASRSRLRKCGTSLRFRRPCTAMVAMYCPPSSKVFSSPSDCGGHSAANSSRSISPDPSASSSSKSLSASSTVMPSREAPVNTSSLVRAPFPSKSNASNKSSLVMAESARMDPRPYCLPKIRFFRLAAKKVVRGSGNRSHPSPPSSPSLSPSRRLSSGWPWGWLGGALGTSSSLARATNTAIAPASTRASCTLGLLVKSLSTATALVRTISVCRGGSVAPMDPPSSSPPRAKLPSPPSTRASRAARAISSAKASAAIASACCLTASGSSSTGVLGLASARRHSRAPAFTRGSWDRKFTPSFRSAIDAAYLVSASLDRTS